MPSPILALQHNITYAFENPNGSAVEQLRRAVEEGRVSHELGLDFTPGVPQVPRAIRDNNGPPSLELHVALTCPVYIDFSEDWLARLDIYDKSGISCMFRVTKRKFLHDAMVETSARAIGTRYYPIDPSLGSAGVTQLSPP